MTSITGVLVTMAQTRHILYRMEVKGNKVQEQLLEIEKLKGKDLINVLNGSFFDIGDVDCSALVKINLTLNDLDFDAFIKILYLIVPDWFSIS